MNALEKLDEFFTNHVFLLIHHITSLALRDNIIYDIEYGRISDLMLMAVTKLTPTILS